MRATVFAGIGLSLACAIAHSQEAGYELPFAAEMFEQDVHRAYTTQEGLPDNNVLRVARDAGGRIVAETAGGWAIFQAGQWRVEPQVSSEIFAKPTLVHEQRARLRNVAAPNLRFAP